MNFKIALPLLLLLMHQSVVAANCVAFSSSELKLNWRAFKTPLRQEVEGSFKELHLKRSSQVVSEFKGEDVSTLLKGLEIEIPTDSIATGIAKRDENISKYLFAGRPIKARVTDVTKNQLGIDLFLNQKLVHTKLQWKTEKAQLKAYGYVDVLDFGLGQELAALTKECFALHEGKTWSDVRIDITVPLKECTR